MSQQVTVVMYHYVRPSNEINRLKALELGKFKKQLEFFNENFSFVKMEDVADAIYKNKKLPENSILLTFDDGYKDNFTHVFPILRNMGIQGSFFVSQAILDGYILDINKIQFILASIDEYQIITDMISTELEYFKGKFKIHDYSWYRNKLLQENVRYDDEITHFIKRMLQRELPRSIRNKIIDTLFREYVSKNETEFAKSLYLNRKEIAIMQTNDMFFGGHGHKHLWMNGESGMLDADLDLEIGKSYEFCKEYGKGLLSISYPSNSYDANVIEKFKNLDFKLGFTGNIGKAIMDKDNAMILNRYDTNDFPQ